MFTVGGFARVAGISARQLRKWDDAGLFSPAWVDPASGYRWYSPAQLPELRRRLALRDLGMGLAEIRRLVDEGTDLRTALEQRRAVLEHERREVERRLAELDIRVALGDAQSTQPDVVVRGLASENVATLDLSLVPDGDMGRAFYELESHVRDLGVRAARPPGAIDAHEGRPRVIFVPVRRAIAPTDRIGVRRLPATRAVTLLHRGAYDGVVSARRQLADWIAAARLRPAGPLQVRYLQFGAEAELRVPRPFIVERAADLVTELQLPVE